MVKKLKLISENPDLLDDFEVVEEQNNLKDKSSLYIKGPFIGCNIVNKNKRYYDINETRPEVQRYITEMVEPMRAMGELNHPSNAEVNLERACHIVTQLNEEDGNVFYGKSKVLTTPLGEILRSLINDGVRVGMSTRALGTLEEGTGMNRVKNMRLVAIDAVADPSYPKAFVNGILESKSYVLDSAGHYEEIYDNLEESIATLPKRDVDSYLKEQIMQFINKL